MPSDPDESKWLPEAQVARLVGLSRSVLRSWAKAGLEAAAGASYGLDDLITIVLLAKCRGHLSPKEMLGAWQRLTANERGNAVMQAARELSRGDRFDLVIDEKYRALEIARNDAELAKAVRRKQGRAMVVLDASEEVVEAVEYFEFQANEGAGPTSKSPGRPRSAERALRVVGGTGGGG